jgi:hypothetical protein
MTVILMEADAAELDVEDGRGKAHGGGNPRANVKFSWVQGARKRWVEAPRLHST